MKNKYFLVLVGVLFISSCEAFSGSDLSGDRLFADTTFKDIPRHDSVDCYGSCSVKIYNQ